MEVIQLQVQSNTCTLLVVESASLKEGQNKRYFKRSLSTLTAKFWISVSAPWRQAVVFLGLQKQLRNVWNIRHDWTTSMQLHAELHSAASSMQNRRAFAELGGRWSVPGQVQTSPSQAPRAAHIISRASARALSAECRLKLSPPLPNGLIFKDNLLFFSSRERVGTDFQK